MVIAQPVHCIRSLHAFTHGVNGRGGRTGASLRGFCNRHGRRLHNSIPTSTSTLGFAADRAPLARLVGVSRAEKGELWQ